MISRMIIARSSSASAVTEEVDFNAASAHLGSSAVAVLSFEELGDTPADRWFADRSPTI
jgi:TolB-like protein